MAKKYYWLKLKKDFFKRHDIRIIEEMPNGKDYILFYMKLLLESIGHNGELRFSQSIPYSDTMLATITNTNIDIVRSAVKIFSELHMMDMLEDGTIFMSQVNTMLGCETDFAEKKRLYREKKKQIPDNRGTKKDNVRQEIEKEKEKEIEIDIEKEVDKIKFHDYVYLTQEEHQKLIDEYKEQNVKEYIEKLDNYLTQHPDKKLGEKKGYKDLYKTLRSWLNKDRIEHRSKYGSPSTTRTETQRMTVELARKQNEER